MSKISDAHIVDGARDFRLMTRQMTDAILSLAEYNRFSKGIFSWVGFRTKWLEYENVERVAGQTKWSFWKLFLYSLEGSRRSRPCHWYSRRCSVSSFASSLRACGRRHREDDHLGRPVAGYPSLMSVVLFIGGVQLFTIGILGQYIAKTYLEAKGRPVYIVREARSDRFGRAAIDSFSPLAPSYWRAPSPAFAVAALKTDYHVDEGITLALTTEPGRRPSSPGFSRDGLISRARGVRLQW
jgi:hypothetical protein